MNEKYTKEYIYQLLEQAKAADPEYKVFGASKHKYQLNPPASKEAVLALEAEFHIKLPEEYVYFLTEIGNGGAGPHYGLYSLEELKMYQNCIQKDDVLSPVIDSNLSKEMWNTWMEQMDTDDDDVYDEIEEQINTGVFVIGTQGCTFDNLLMCCGSETGKMVYIDWNLEYNCPPFLTKMSFLEWYVGFFQDIIAGYNMRSYGYVKRANEVELIEDYTKSAVLDEKLNNLQGLMRLDKLTDDTVKFLYNLNDREIDEARIRILLKYHTNLGMNLFDKFIEGENIAAAVSVIRSIPKEFQLKYYKRAIEILHKDDVCDRQSLLFYITDQECRKASDIVEYAKNVMDEDLKSTAIYALGKCSDAMEYEEYFIEWMKGDSYRIAHTALQAAISSNHRSYRFMETFRWMGEKYKKDSVMCSNLKCVL